MNQKLKVLWIGCGTEDPGYNGVKAMDDLLTKKNVKHVWNQSGGGHSWPNWQVYLSKYAPLLFRISKWWQAEYSPGDYLRIEQLTLVLNASQKFSRSSVKVR